VGEVVAKLLASSILNHKHAHLHGRHVSQEVTKVFLGAAALMSNGAALARAGTVRHGASSWRPLEGFHVLVNAPASPYFVIAGGGGDDCALSQRAGSFLL
jgi:hypothetical protein